MDAVLRAKKEDAIQFAGNAGVSSGFVLLILKCEALQHVVFVCVFVHEHADFTPLLFFQSPGSTVQSSSSLVSLLYPMFAALTLPTDAHVLALRRSCKCAC